MDTGQFRQAITNGLGRAILWLRDHPWRPHAEAVEGVCLHNPAYDPQCEGSRAEYVYEAIRLTGERVHFAKLVTRALLEAKDYWDVCHLFRLAFLLARDGDTEAGRAIYEKFDRDDAGGHFVGAEEVMNLGGLKGLLFVLDRVGRHIEVDPGYRVDACLLDEAEGLFGAGVKGVVREAAEANPNVRRYVGAVEASRNEVRQRRVPDHRRLTYRELRGRIVAAPCELPRYWLFRWGKHASEADLRQAAADLQTEADERVLTAYVRLFAWRPFPLDPRRLVELAASEDGDLATAARRALRHVRDASVRTLALRLISGGLADGDVASLLARNFEPGDELLLKSLLDRESNEDEFHWLAHAAVDVVKANADAGAGPPMLRIYERCRCSLCRMAAVEVLIERQVAPPWLLDECRYDSNVDIRNMVAG